jgi:hypothetical protein
MNPTDPIFHKPKSIIAAKNILYASIFLGIIISVISEMTIHADSYPSGQGYSSTQGLIINLVTIILLFVLARLIGLGRKWARTVYLLLFILGIALFPFGAIAIFKMNILVGILDSLQIILQAMALKFLFSKESTHRFLSVSSFVPQ